MGPSISYYLITPLVQAPMSRHRARSHKDCASLLPLSAHPRTPLASIPHLAAVQGVIENGSPKIPNLLGKVIGIFLGLILFMRLVVMLVITTVRLGSHRGSATGNRHPAARPATRVTRRR